jgi:hypothetical protein
MHATWNRIDLRAIGVPEPVASWLRELKQPDRCMSFPKKYARSVRNRTPMHLPCASTTGASVIPFCISKRAASRTDIVRGSRGDSGIPCKPVRLRAVPGRQSGI